MKRAADHERYLGTIKSLARAEELQQRDKAKNQNKEPEKEEQTCLNCDKKKSCKVFNGKMTVEGVYSIGGEATVKTCDKWKERKDNPSNPKKIKSLMKQFSKMR
jgi:hypothetical protein